MYGFTPDVVLGLTLPQVDAYLSGATRRQYEREVHLAQLLAMLASMNKDNEGVTPKDFLTPLARAAAEDAKPNPYTVIQRRALNFAAKHKLLSPRATDLVDWDFVAPRKGRA